MHRCFYQPHNEEILYVYENEFNSFFNKNFRETLKRVRDLTDWSIHNWCFGGFKTIAFCKPENLV